MLPNFDQAYFFGDSLTAIDNTLNFTGGAFPNFPYQPGRFSNGDIWVDYLTDELNLTIDPFITGFDPNSGIIFDLSDSNDGVNFAIGGANSANGNVGVVPLGLEQQIDTFELLVQNQEPEEVLEDDLFFLWAGANDYFGFIDDDPTTPDTIEADFPSKGKEIKQAVLDVVDINIGGAIQEIIDLGGKDIVVFNLPDLTVTPLGQKLDPSDQKSLKKLSRKHNKQLLETIESLEHSNPNVDIIHVNINPIVKKIIRKPHKFGFTNVTDNFTGIDLYTGISEPPSSGNPNDYLFFDSVHITTKGQNLIADLVMDELTNEGLII